MKYTQDCQSCGRKIVLTYDEMDGTPLFCPFCGEEQDDSTADYDDAPGIKGDDDSSNWDEDDER